MSQSHNPTRALVCSSATARFAAIVDLPTPPLPLATAMTCLIPGIRAAPMPAPAPPGGAWMSIKTLALRTPSRARSACSASFLIVAGTFGSFVARASCTLTSPLSILTDLTRPNETMSRVKPGYFTDFSAFIACSSEIDMYKLTRGLSDVNRSVAVIDPDNPVCSESDSHFRYWGEKVARQLSQQSPGFANQTRRGISPSLGWPASGDGRFGLRGQKISTRRDVAKCGNKVRRNRRARPDFEVHPCASTPA